MIQVPFVVSYYFSYSIIVDAGLQVYIPAKQIIGSNLIYFIYFSARFEPIPPPNSKLEHEPRVFSDH